MHNILEAKEQKQEQLTQLQPGLSGKKQQHRYEIWTKKNERKKKRRQYNPFSSGYGGKSEGGEEEKRPETELKINSAVLDALRHLLLTTFTSTL